MRYAELRDFAAKNCHTVESDREIFSRLFGGFAPAGSDLRKPSHPFGHGSPPPVTPIRFENSLNLCSRQTLCRGRKRNDIALFCYNGREGHPLRLSNAVFPAEVAIRAHRQRAAVLMSKPAGNSWNIHAAFDAPCCEEVPQIVMCDAIRPDFLARSIKSLLTFADAEHFRVQ